MDYWFFLTSVFLLTVVLVTVLLTVSFFILPVSADFDVSSFMLVSVLVFTDESTLTEPLAESEAFPVLFPLHAGADMDMAMANSGSENVLFIVLILKC